MDKALIDSILRLKPAERLKLLDIIHGSLERPDASIDELWYTEAERRLAAYKAGGVKAVPAGDVLGQHRRLG